MIVSLTDRGSALPGLEAGHDSWGLPIAQQQIVSITPAGQGPPPERLYRYHVVYKWEPTQLGSEIAMELPAKSKALEKVMVKVWRQALGERAAEVELDGKKFPVRETPRKHLREVDFVFEGEPLRGLEQNPKTESRWAQLARAGHKVMQILSAGRYVGNVMDGLNVGSCGGEDKQIPRCARNDRERQGQREGTMYRAPTANYKHH